MNNNSQGSQDTTPSLTGCQEVRTECSGWTGLRGRSPFSLKYPANEGGMNERIKRLRQENFDTPTTLSIERALIETEFYKQNYGTMPIAVLRARNFY